MGTPIDPYEPGDPCSICWGAGKPFGDVETPLRVLMKISGVKPGAMYESFGSPPLNGSFLLQQTSPCRWRMAISPFNAVWEPWVDANQAFTEFYFSGIWYNIFVGSAPTTCHKFFLNDNQTYTGGICYGGQCEIIWEGL